MSNPSRKNQEIKGSKDKIIRTTNPEKMKKKSLTSDEKEKVVWAQVSVASNTFLMCLKLIIGIIIVSISVVSEALHTSLDLFASILAAYAIQKATIPADKDHTFGHGKYENLSGTVQAVMIFVVSLLIIYEASMRIHTWIYHGVEQISVDLGIVVMLISTLVNFTVGRKLFIIAKKYDSISLEANAYHLWADVYTSLGVFAGLVVIRVGQYLKIVNISYLDPIIAIIIAVIILKTAYDITKRSMQGLLDGKLPDNEERIIHEVIKEYCHQFVEYHDFRSRKSGSERHIDLHLVVAKHINVEKAHDICDNLEKKIEKKLPKTKVVIHTEPCDGKCKKCIVEKVHHNECGGKTSEK